MPKFSVIRGTGRIGKMGGWQYQYLQTAWFDSIAPNTGQCIPHTK